MPMFSFQILEDSRCPKCGFSLENEGSLNIDDRHNAHVSELGYIVEDTTGACLMLSHAQPEIVCENCLHDIDDIFRFLDET